MDSTKNVPAHVSIIMDGNGRWAKNRGLERGEGHKVGIESVREVTEAAVQAGVKYLSLYAFSEENWGRPQAEVDGLMKLMMKSISEEVGTMMKNNVRFMVLGNRARLSTPVNMAIDGLMKMTQNNTAMTMIVFISYSGKWDILQAAKAMARKLAEDPSYDIDSVDFDGFSSYLVTNGIPDPDLLVRTSGEQRLSNYLLWQSAYSEFYFTDVLWPDFRKEEFNKALQAYAERDRRYGKVK